MKHFEPGDLVRITGNADPRDEKSPIHFFDIGAVGKVLRCIKAKGLYLVESDGFGQIVKAEYLAPADEAWRDIKGYEGLYEVSNYGEVRNVFTGVILQPGDSGANALLVNLTKDGRRRSHIVRRLVADAFIPNPQNLPFIAHKTGDYTDNRAINLAWCARIMKHK